MPFRWFKPLAAVAVVGLGIRAYAETTRDKTTTFDRIKEERHRHDELMDQYGSRDSLEELENAIQFYEKRR
jgi:hypothetical protein